VPGLSLKGVTTGHRVYDSGEDDQACNGRGSEVSGGHSGRCCNYDLKKSLRIVAGHGQGGPHGCDFREQHGNMLGK
jgi:hypothetical protein